MEGCLRKPTGSVALLAAAGLLALFTLLAVSSCDPCDGSLDPIECSDLCEQDPPHAECAQCRGPVLDLACPQCVAFPPLAGCPNFNEASSGSSGLHDASADSGSSGSGTFSGSGGINGSDSGEAGITGGVSGAGNGGTTGGSPSLSCSGDTNCPSALPVCSNNECVACTAAAQCTPRGETPQCDDDVSSDTLGECVECTIDDHCASGGMRHCVNRICEQCGTNAHCTGFATAQCDAGECVACTSSVACADHGARDGCNLDGPAATRGQCVQCESHADCPDDAPRCDATGACAACSGVSAGNAACAGRVGNTMCNLRDDADTFGECVQCTAENESAACGGDSCNRSTGACTGTDRDSVSDCGDCVADSECQMGMRCVEHVLNGTRVGSFCFLADPLGGCASNISPLARPYSEPGPTTSIDGYEADFCLPRTSCAAYLDSIALGALGGKACTSGEECGVGDPDVDGAFCIDIGSPTLDDHCSYTCENDRECPGSGHQFDTCPTTGFRFCRP